MNQLASEEVALAAPLSFHGSAARIWRLRGLSDEPWRQRGLTALAVLLIAAAWIFVLAWYMSWGLLLVPYRLVRRGQRKRKMEELRHQELLQTMNDKRR